MIGLLASCRTTTDINVLPLHRLTLIPNPSCAELSYGSCIIEYKTINDQQNKDKEEFLSVINGNK